MTLCVVWRDHEGVHFASDSRVTLAKNSYADVGIKVLCLPYQIYSPQDNSGIRTLYVSGELGMCFAGSAVNSLFIKESIAEVLKGLQYVPGYSNISMDGLVKLVFTTYQLISQKVCSTALGGNGRSALVITGWCTDKQCIRSYLLETSDSNTHSYTEILKTQNTFEFVGSGKGKAETISLANPTKTDFLQVLKSVIEDPAENSVGGAIQYGYITDRNFKICGIVEFNEGVHYWRGALDLNSNEFMGGNDVIIPMLTYIDPFNTFDQ